MKLRIKLSFFLGWLIVSSFGWDSIAGTGETATAFELNAEPVSWSRLSYRAKSIFGKVTTDVGLKSVNVADGVELIITDPAGEALQPNGTTFYSLTVDSKIDPLFGADETLKTRSWFEPHNAGALQRIRLRLGQDKWQKSYRFTKKGVLRLRKKPKDSSEENLPVDQWTKIREHFYSYGDNGRSCQYVLEPSSLLYISSAVNLTTAPNHLIFCVFNKKKLFHLNVLIKEHRRIKVSYLEKAGRHQIRRDKKIEAVLLSFEPRALVAEDSQSEEFSFLGLKGNFEVYIDEATHLPVQISGKISPFGQIDIKLQEAELTKQPLAQ